MIFVKQKVRRYKRYCNVYIRVLELHYNFFSCCLFLFYFQYTNTYLCAYQIQYINEHITILLQQENKIIFNLSKYNNNSQVSIKVLHW